MKVQIRDLKVVIGLLARYLNVGIEGYKLKDFGFYWNGSNFYGKVFREVCFSC